ncbi:hypothetical protein CIT292_08275 [Citrobacter youngae ATCC 29220]|uniref:Uncharacterized protein n=1 Tax=Citrobacter youngae ATCC 29220 TaxID=500640 RepID=D4BCR1_9ENTR|nr:hypothetical protein CIT292_08275 [Citrobacter youngae ATCC 29220]
MQAVASFFWLKKEFLATRGMLINFRITFFGLNVSLFISDSTDIFCIYLKH